MKESIAIKNFIEYWDDWHSEWFKNIKDRPDKIRDWKIPYEKGDNENSICYYFPEPYWGNPYSDEIVAVFLNLNPGGGGECQDIKSDNKSTSNLYSIYSTSYLYSKTIEQLSSNLCYNTTNWFDKKRVRWLSKLFSCNSANYQNKFTVCNILCADLIPWHTPTFNSKIEKYVIEHRQQIFDYVIKPITIISQQATLKGFVFAKGRATEKILSKIIGVPIQYKNGKFEINLFNYGGAVIIVFVGGQGMYLPNPCEKKYQDENMVKLSVYEILKNK